MSGLQQFFQLGNQRRQVILDGIPHQFFVHFEIDMHYAIPHGAHETPGNRFIFFFDLFRNLICRFTDYDEIHLNRSNGLLIVSKDFIIHAIREFLDFGNGIQNIPNSILPASR